MNAKKNTTKRLQLKQDRQLIRSRWHSARFVVASARRSKPAATSCPSHF